jgi:hypothetical protein
VLEDFRQKERKMLTLSCVIVGEGSVVPVVCEASTLVSIVKKKIRKEKQYSFPADKLTLYVAKKDGKLDGEWLR